MDTYYCVVLALFFRIYAIAFPLVQSQGLLWALDKNSHIFDYHTTTSLHDQSTKTDPAVGFKLDCQLEISPLWMSSDTTLLKLRFSNLKLASLSKFGLRNDFNFLSRYPFFSLWHNGKTIKLFGVNQESKFSLNLKRGVNSMIQVSDQAEVKEHDVRGECLNRYLKGDDKLNKSTKECITNNFNEKYENVEKLFDSTILREYTSSFTFTQDKEFQEIVAFETLEFKTNLIAGVSSKISVNQTLTRVRKVHFKNEIGATSLDEALKLIKKDFKVEEISLEADINQIEREKQKLLSNFLDESKDKFKNMATEEAAFAFSQLVQAIRRSSGKDIENLLAEKKHKDIRNILVDACSAAQTKESLNAVMKVVDFNDEVLTERFLLAAAFSTHPKEELLRVFLKYLKLDIENDKIRESIAGALGAILHAYSYNPDNNPVLIKEILILFENRLKKCEDVLCTLINIRALGNAGHSSSITTLLELAKSHTSSEVNEAALKALRKMKQLNSDNLKILKEIYHQDSRGYDTAVRAKALRYILKNNFTYDDVLKIVESLNEPYNTELATFTKAYLFDKSSDNENLRKMLHSAIKSCPQINTYNGLATKGKSLSFHNLLAQSQSFDSIYDMYVENTRTGVMKRSGMDVDLNGVPIYSFGLFSAGVESLLGEESDDDSVVTAGLSLDMLGIGFRPITFFSGRSGLMSAVWSAPSTMTSALQANMLLQDKNEFFKLSNGIVVNYNVIGSISMDLSGLISISLWNKNAHTEIMNTGAYSLTSTLQIASPFYSKVEHDLKGTGIINFDSDVDFYDKLKSCLQMSRPSINIKHQTLKSEKIRGFKGYAHTRKRSFLSHGVCYPLPKKNHDMCREMIKDKN